MQTWLVQQKMQTDCGSKPRWVWALPVPTVSPSTVASPFLTRRVIKATLVARACSVSLFFTFHFTFWAS